MRFTPASQITSERVTWIWQDRIPAGKITCVDGHPGLGKSTLMLDIAASVSTAREMPDGSPCARAGDVLVLSAEDDSADTIVPRLTAAGADLARVHVEPVIIGPNDEGIDDVSLPVHVGLLDEEIDRLHAAMVIIDPFSAYVDSKVNLHRDQDSRGVMRQLKTLAAKHNCAVVLIRHFTKSGGTDAVLRGQGSIGIIGAARASLVVARDPGDDTRTIVAPGKANLARAGIPALAFRLENVEALGCARVAWEGTTDHRAEDLLGAEGAGERSALAAAREFLREFLADGPRSSTEVLAAAQSAGLTERTVRRAKTSESVEANRPGGPRTPWYWSYPPDPNMANTPDTANMAQDGHVGHLEPEDTPGEGENQLPPGEMPPAPNMANSDDSYLLDEAPPTPQSELEVPDHGSPPGARVVDIPAEPKPACAPTGGTPREVTFDDFLSRDDLDVDDLGTIRDDLGELT